MYTCILVTGGCGFIASNYLNYMVAKYPKIKFVNLDAMYYCASHDNILVSDKPNYVFVKGKVQDQPLVETLLEEHQVDAVLHFAAQSHVDNSFGESLTYTRDNVLGTHVLLESCRRYGKIKRFIHVSTDEVYGESSKEGQPIVQKMEQTVLCPTNPYAATKAAAEMIVNSYIHSYNMPIIITRGNNVYGRNQYPEKLIPKFIQLLQDNKKMTIQGKGNQLRSFLHVDDVARAFELILFKGKLHEIYNVGTPEEIMVIEVARKLLNLVHPGEKLEDWITYIRDREYNDFRYFITNDKLVALGWKQEVGFDEGLGSLVNTLKKKNKCKNIIIGIAGLGFVGGSIYKSLTIKGVPVVGYDKYKINFKNFEPLLTSTFIFLALPTLYSEEHTEFDKTILETVCNQLMEKKYKGVVIIKSTVEPGTSEKLANKYNLKIIHNPEFLTARTALHDFQNQTHIVLGKTSLCSQEDLNVVKKFYIKYWNNAEFSFATSQETEAMKLACNTFYAVKVQYFNELYFMCQNLKINFDIVKTMMLKNKWINPMHTNVPGPDGLFSYGGACFPKDSSAMLQIMKKQNGIFGIVDSCIKERNLMRSNNKYTTIGNT